MMRLVIVNEEGAVFEVTSDWDHTRRAIADEPPGLVGPRWFLEALDGAAEQARLAPFQVTIDGREPRTIWARTATAAMAQARQTIPIDVVAMTREQAGAAGETLPLTRQTP